MWRTRLSRDLDFANIRVFLWTVLAPTLNAVRDPHKRARVSAGDHVKKEAK